MRHTDDNPPHLTEADRLSHTRFGPRPVPEGHIPASGRSLSRQPETTLSTKIIVWGGVALGVAGATAAALTAARKIADVTRDDPRPRRWQTYYGDRMTGMAPRFAELDEADREAIRKRVRAQAREDAQNAAKQRAEAGRKRDTIRGSGNFAHDLTRTAGDLSNSIDGVTNSLVKAFDSFRGVALQSGRILSEFAAAAEQIRSIMGRTPPSQARPEEPERRDAKMHATQDRLHKL